MICENFEELEDPYLMGALDRGKTAELDRHLAHCTVCSTRLKAHEETLGKLFSEVQPIPPPAFVRSALLQKLTTLEAPSKVISLPPRPKIYLPVLGAGLAAALIIGLLVWTFYLQTNLVAANQNRTQALKLYDYTSSSDTLVWTMQPDDRTNFNAPRARMFVRPKSDYFIVTASKLPQPEGGKIYRVWTISGDKPNSRPEFLTNLEPDPQGYASVILPDSARAIKVISCFVTLESGQDTEPLAPKLLTWNLG